jgi:hypothetical protein
VLAGHTTILEEVFSHAFAYVRRGTPEERSGLTSLATELVAILNANDLEIARHRREGWQLVLVHFAASQTVIAIEHEASIFGIPFCDLPAHLLRTGDVELRAAMRGTRGSKRQVLDALRLLGKSPEITQTVQAPALTDDDIRLALTWMRDVTQSSSQEVDRLLDDRTPRTPVLDSTTGREVERCLSARRAELLVSRVMQALECRVTDISILQILEPTTHAWRLADLLVDGQPVDVKNSRRRSDGRYSGTFVKRFKTDSSAVAVQYAGVSSTYQGTLQRYHVSVPTTEVAFLGITTEGQITEFERESGDGVSVEIVRKRHVGMEIPTWAFALPRAAYAEHERVAVEISRSLCAPESFDIGLRHRIAAITHSFDAISPEPLWNEIHLTEDPLLQIAEDIRRKGRIPVVAMQGVLKSFLADVATGRTKRRLRTDDLLFPNARMPLCVYDPTEAIRSLCDILDLLLDRADTALRSVRRIALRGQQQMIGVTPTGQVVTLVVYCGSCLNYPLVRGREHDCGNDKGHLRCTCGWCPCEPLPAHEWDEVAI